MSTDVLSSQQVNTSNSINPCEMKPERRPDDRSMEYHPNFVQTGIEEKMSKRTYLSPSDTIMSPCSAKLSAYRNKQVGKAKPKALFAKTLTKNLPSSGLFPLIPNTKVNMKKETCDS